MKLSFVLVLFLLVAGSLQAQEGGRGNRASSDLPVEEVAANRTKNLDKVVGMTPDQEEKVKAIYVEFLNAQKKVRQDYKDDSDNMMEKMEEVRNNMNEKVKEVLDDEQYKLFKEASQKRRSRGSGRRGGNQ
ncbi:hypothetical protein [Marinilabilia rubra]|uniref:DUF4890 domain-containing protein n=1 Tax=Marinilabilia rubra TaxID=2162893 RepID=A0A2U2B964_9BACT|nr:hypothetical protein [Marinilabilia rubra]PWD99576.1 hypothetical protein DDZ16_08970 [Marinilabilia rubra]